MYYVLTVSLQDLRKNFIFTLFIFVVDASLDIIYY